MKITKKDLHTGEIRVIPQNFDDLYLLYQVIRLGDFVRSKTSRKIKAEESQAGKSNRINLILTIKVEGVEYKGYGDNLRVKGIVTESTDEQVDLHSYHTLNIQPLKQLTIIKQDKWLSYDLELVESSQMGSQTGVYVIALDDDNATVAQIGLQALRIILELNPSIPRKSGNPTQHVLETQNFFQELASFMLNQTAVEASSQFYIGGPGFTSSLFQDFLVENHPIILKNAKFIGTKTSRLAGINEILRDHISEDALETQKTKVQIKHIEELLNLLSSNDKLVAYGENISQAITYNAVNTLLILDTLFQSTVEERQLVDSNIEKVKQTNGNVVVVNPNTPNSKIIEGLGGIVALLRFPLT